MSEICLITCVAVMAVLVCVLVPNLFGLGLGRKRPWPFSKEPFRHLPGVKMGNKMKTILRIADEEARTHLSPESALRGLARPAI